MTFHDSFLNKSAAISTLRHTRPDLLFLAHQTRTTHRPRFARRHPRHGVAFTSAAHALRYAIGQTDVQYIYMLPTAQCQVVDASAPHVPVSAALAHAVTMGAVLIDVASLPAAHDMSQISPLHVSTMRPLAINADDPTSVHVLVDDTQMSIRAVYVARWSGWDRQHRRAWSHALSRWFVTPRYRKKVHPHLLRMYLDQMAPTTTTTPSRERWPCSQKRILLARTACTQSTGSLIWVFLFQPLSARDLSSHRRWALAPLTQTPGEEKWQL